METENHDNPDDRDIADVSDAADAPITRRGSDPILDSKRLGKDKDDPGHPFPKTRDPDDGASKDPRDCGNNGNPAQSSGRVTMQEQNEHPASLDDPEASTFP